MLAETLLSNSRLMFAAPENDIGPDLLILVHSSSVQADFWQKRLTGPDGIHGSGTLVKKNAAVLSIAESNWQGGPGNGLGTLNGIVQAAHLANRFGLIQDNNTDLRRLLAAFLPYLRDKAVFMLHTAGKGTRMSPLPGAECNSKSNIKLPRMLNLAGRSGQMTILEAVILQTSVYAPSRPNRLTVFWGDQIILHHSDIRSSGNHDIEILGQPVTVSEEIKAYGILIPCGQGICRQREKMVMTDVIKLLPAGSREVYKSIGSFSISLEFLQAMLHEEYHFQCLQQCQGSLNTDPDWWQPLTSSLSEYIADMAKKNITAAQAEEKWHRIHNLWAGLRSSHGRPSSSSGATATTSPTLGFCDVGKDSLWWDYGQTKYYLRNMQLLAESSPEADVARAFFGIAPDSWLLHASLGTAETSHSVIHHATIKRGRLKNCVVFDSCLEEVHAENAVIFGSQIKSLQIQGGLCYNVVTPQAQLASGDILAGIACPQQGDLRMRTHISRNGQEDWDKRVCGNPYSYSEIAQLMTHGNLK